MKDPKHRAKQRFKRQDWIDLGLDMAAQESPDAMTLEAVCAAANKTRGSFYHHFPAHADFLEAVAERWLQRDTEDVIAANTADGSLGDRLHRLNEMTAALDPRLERGIRQLAAAYPALARYVRIADDRRRAHICALYAGAGAADPDTAERLAALIYAAFVGFAFVEPDASPARRAALFDLLPSEAGSLAKHQN